MEAKTNIDIKQVKKGMFWYEDDTFSFERVPDKKIKAIVELAKDGVVYGDLTASELFENHEQFTDWFGAKKYIEQFPYQLKQNEEIVWYNIHQLSEIKKHYNLVEESFKLIGKRCRQFSYWACEIHPSFYAKCLAFEGGFVNILHKTRRAFIRPVLSLKVDISRLIH